jgi:predicted RNase H-like HicB family nuclease
VKLLPECVATGATRAAVEATMREAIALHLEGMRADGEPIPTPHTYVTTIEVAA